MPRAGQKMTAEQRARCSAAQKARGPQGPQPGRWKPDASYVAKHLRIRTARGHARDYLCDGCCGGRAQEWARRHDRSGDHPEDYVPLCRSCHNEYDHELLAAGARMTHAIRRGELPFQ